MDKITRANKKIFEDIRSLIHTWDDNFDEDLLDCCRILMIVSGADGDISEDEWQVIFEFVNSVGGNMDIVDYLKDFAYEKAKLDDYIFRIDPDLHKPLLYSAIKVARADGLDEAEREKAQQLAKLAGMEIGIAKSIENVLNLEEEVRNLRNIMIFNQ